MTQELCSTLARHEPLLGTAQQNTLHFVMAWPKREWLSHIENMENAAGVFARLVKKYDKQALLSLKSCEPDERGTVWLFPHGYRFDGLTTNDYANLLEQALNRQITMPYTPMENPQVILICTHGKRDTCCAKFGTTFASTLRDLTQIPVWEVSHLGGHRFAATLVVQPESHWYGQLEPVDAPALLHAIENQAILTERYRGSAHYPPPLQVAEFWGWQQILDDHPTGEIHLVNPKISGSHAEVVVSIKTDDHVRQTALTLEGRPYTFVADCDGSTKDRLIWEVVEVHEYQST